MGLSDIRRIKKQHYIALSWLLQDNSSTDAAASPMIQSSPSSAHRRREKNQGVIL